MRDSVNENCIYKDGNSVSFKGTISLFTEYPPAVDRTKIIESLRRASLVSKEETEVLSKPINETRPLVAVTDKNPDKTKKADKSTTSKDSSKKPQEKSSDIKVENTPAGIRLTIQNLQFKPDSAELLPGEENRLDQIASVLKEAGNSQFLVEGHTASTGYEKGEMKLSAERAHAVAEALSKKGIQASRFITKGSGAHKPIADNATPEGKAMNRRVEITILE